MYLNIKQYQFIKKNRLKEFFLNLLIVVFIILSLILELKLDGGLIVNKGLIFTLGLLIVIFVGFNILNNLNFTYIKSTSLLMLIIFLFILFNSLFIRHYFLFGAVFNLFISIVIAKQLSINRYSSNLYLIPFWLLVAYIIMRLNINLDPNEVFLRSRNYISFFLIITVMPYYYIKLLRHESTSIFPALILLILSIYSLGRSGTIASLLILLGIALSKNISKKMLFFIAGAFFTLSTIILLYIIEKYAGAMEYERLFSIIESLQHGARGIILQNYINNLDWISLIFGMETNIPKILDFGGSYIPGHVHSSILNFISVTGISSILLFLFLINHSIYLYKYNLPLLLLLFAIILRITTEIGLLFGYFDYIIWMFLFVKFNKFNNIKINT